MRVVLDGGEVIDLAVTEATPTISMVDYSRRDTDDFGVTTVVERDFARRMAVKLILPFDQASALQRTLADLRATAARWVADDRFSWLNFRGFYRDFEIDLALPPISYCTLTVEGLAANEPFTDTGEDPAPNGDASSLQLLQPVTISDAALVSSNVPENDAPEWSAGTSYPVGARVIKVATHRIYESGAAGNVGNDPAGASGKWIDVGPTNRWAMLDQALGSVTTGQNSVAVTLAAGTVDAVALLDVTAGATVRVQAPGYDRSAVALDGVTITFLDLPRGDNQVTVTVSGAGNVSIGTLLIGSLVGLGGTLESPKAGITDFSRKEADEFGEVTIVERAWAKRMSLGAMIRTDAIDLVAGRIAAVRAKPSLWIGMDGLDAITAYGFFKDFSIEVDAMVSKLSLSIEGLSTAGKVEPLTASVAWPDVTDPDGTKPQDNADVTSENTAKDTAAVGGVPAPQVIIHLAVQDARLTQLDADTAQALINITAAQGTITQIQSNATAAGVALDKAKNDILAAGGRIDTVESTVGGLDASISTIQQAVSNQVGEIATLKTRVSANSVNLIRNGSFETGDGSYWNFTNAQPWGFARTGPWGSYVGTGVNIPDGSYAFIDTEVVQIEAPDWYTFTADVGHFQTGSGVHYCEIIWLDANRAYMGQQQGNVRPQGNNFDATNAQRNDLAVTLIIPSGAVYAYGRISWRLDGGTVQSFHARQAKFERGRFPTAYSAEASITQTFTALSSQSGTLASLSTTVSTQGVTISSQATAISGLNIDVATLSQTVSAQGTSISTQATAITSLEGRTGTLETRVSTANPNLLKNGSFEDGFNNWHVISQPGSRRFDVRESTWGSYAGFYNEGPPLVGGLYYFDSDDSFIDGNQTYTVTANVDFAGANGSEWVRLELLWLNDAGQLLGQAYGPTVYGGRWIGDPVSNRRDLKLTAQSPLEARRVRVRPVAYANGGVVHLAWQQIKLETGSVATAYNAEATVTQKLSVLSTLTTNYASLETAVGVQGSTITTQQSAISVLENGQTTLFARSAVRLDVNGYVIGWEINNNGQTGDFLVDADRFAVGKLGQGGMYPFEVRDGFVYISNDLRVGGNVLIGGTVNPEALALGRFVKRAYVEGAGSPAVGQTLLLGSVDLGETSANGSYSLEIAGAMTTNVGVLQSSFNGKPLYTTIQPDGGLLVNVSKNGTLLALHYYSASEYSSSTAFGRALSLSSTRIFDAPDADTFSGGVVIAVYAIRGGTDTGNVNEGDYYSRVASATYSDVSVSIKTKWTFI